MAGDLGLLNNRPTSLAYEARLDRLPENENPYLDAITFDFGTLPFGYAWIFPKRDHLNVGVFRSWPGKRTNKNHLLSFITNHPGLDESNIQNIRAHPIPLGIRQERLHDQLTLLVGDAANLADPWLGEGLYFALRSGKIAAEEILKHSYGEKPNLASYTDRIHHAFTEGYACARCMSLVINTLPGLSVRLLQASTSLQALIMDLLRGEKTYRTIWHEIQTWLPKKLIKRAQQLLPK